ncbi:alpha/beta hydrolase [Arenimonas daejeonensis]|uniref:alpha/beta hydrolase n=1 Tax=Arenimonas daejeonensis TaxID=370777 RepID=UPI0011BF031B|nr:alpha/beta fold hydrolase [Arenimonas daejeonensis]
MSEADWPGPTRAAVFVHGAGGGGWEWGVWARVFAARGFEVIAPDLVAGPQGLAAMTLDDYRAQVRGWMAAVRRDDPAVPVCLVGASLGGLLALACADAAQALVLVNAMPPSGLPDAAPVPDIVPWGRTASLAGTRRALPESDDLAALHAFRRWRDESGLALRQARAGWPLPAPDCPVLVMASSDDTDVPPGTSATLAATLGARLQPLPGGHVAPLLGRQAAQAAGLAVEWLNEAGAVG